MKIVLIAHNLRNSGGLSIGKSIVSVLPEIAPQHEYLVIVPSLDDYLEVCQRENISLLLCPSLSLRKRWIWEQKKMRPIIRAFQPDWIWALGNVAISRPPCKQSLYFHNAHRVYRNISRLNSNLKQRLYKRISDCFFERGLRFCSRVYCQTDAVQNKLNSVCRYPLDSMGLCPPAMCIPEPSICSEELRAKLSRFDDEQIFKLFYVSAYMPHKNMEILLEVYEQYREILKNTNVFLTIGPEQGEEVRLFNEKIIEKNLTNQIILLGKIDSVELGHYYKRMDALLFPSLLETVGLAHIEAMHFGLPVIASDRDFGHAICDDAAIFVEPTSPESIRDGILLLRDDSKLREELITRGSNRIQDHLKTWTEILRDVLDQEGIRHS